MQELNLIGVKCPLNFVKAKLALEKMPAGEQLEILLDPGEPAETVPKSLMTEGYEIVEEKTKGNTFVLLVKSK